MRSPQTQNIQPLHLLQEHTQYNFQDLQKPQMLSKPVKTNEHNQLKVIQTQHQLENHHYYLHCQHKADKHPFQDHHHSLQDHFQ